MRHEFFKEKGTFNFTCGSAVKLSIMASAGLQEELSCSICLNIYTDPVTLRCGHNFCRVCIGCALDTQEGSGVYTCPDCRETFQKRPILYRSIALRNIADHFHSTQTEQTETGIFCTHCTQSSVPAVKFCLLCKVSLCHKHLRVHSKSAEHALTDPITFLENKQCSIHKKILEYYCTEDKACICVTCSLARDHKGHSVEPLDGAFEKKKHKLRQLREKLTSKREETEKGVQNLQVHRREVQEKAAGVTDRVAALFNNTRKQLERLEKTTQSEISSWEKNISLSVSNLIQQLEMKKDGLYSKILYIDELCNLKDAISVLQEQESDSGDFWNAKDGENADREGHDNKVLDVSDLDKGISEALHSGLSEIIKGVKRGINLLEPADIVLDINTAGNYIHISDDLKTATQLQLNQNRSEIKDRFQCNQVLSTRSFASGQHYWEVETSRSGNLRVGMCYPSIDRKGYQAWIGDNKKSWCLRRWHNNDSNQYSVMHDSKVTQLPTKFSFPKLRVYLDYEAGQLSFYELGGPVRHLYTFNATFTEPLHAALCIWRDGFIKICG
ncbi:E3 ubiquitin/ISG15 ligase TRIM25-like [Pseudophryne corroboree]|uniref:E3 ubiquitin/ISG15 ligase TRIM25-like n=1 Tax=Pseudophryne corroboree TaxID=495146 RepID=UPI0030814E7B